jgi:hypothetical protein
MGFDWCGATGIMPQALASRRMADEEDWRWPYAGAVRNAGCAGFFLLVIPAKAGIQCLSLW